MRSRSHRAYAAVLRPVARCGCVAGGASAGRRRAACQLGLHRGGEWTDEGRRAYETVRACRDLLVGKGVAGRAPEIALWAAGPIWPEQADRPHGRERLRAVGTDVVQGLPEPVKLVVGHFLADKLNLTHSASMAWSITQYGDREVCGPRRH